MRSKGRSRRDVLADLERALQKDSKYEDGRILSSMCTKPQPIAKAAHRMFLSSNLGDAGMFPGSCRLEEKIVRGLSDLLNLQNGAGFVVSGGTEANLMALWAARNRANVCNPEVIVPESAHFSFNKICNLLQLKPVRAGLDGAFKVVPEQVERSITQHTIAIVCSAGTSELGVVDPIPKLSEIATSHNVHLHVDAALGGLIIPFLEPERQNKHAFDFRMDGVKSMTVDPHKMGMSTIPAGCVLFKEKAILEYIKTETPYLTETRQYTFTGTRSGASAAATWAVFESLGADGFKKTVRRCMKLTGFLSNEIEASGFEKVRDPMLNIVAFRTPNSKTTAQNLRNAGWFVSYVPRLDCLRIVVMPHVKQRHLEAFLEDLKKATQHN
jgi:tyrosine decarboxylase/aspartate 1-decarboxylase